MSLPSYPAALRSIVVAALKDSGIAAEVLSSRDANVADDRLPALLVFVDEEQMNLGNQAGTAPIYNCTATLQILLKLRQNSPMEVEAALDANIEAVLTALFSHSQFLRPPMEAVTAITVRRTISAEAENPIGEAIFQMQIAYTRDMTMPSLGALTSIRVVYDLASPFDATGAYDPAFPAPRTIGPDGRAEAVSTTTFS